MKAILSLFLGLAGGAAATWLLMSNGDEGGKSADYAQSYPAAEYEKLQVKFEQQGEDLKRVTTELAELKQERQALVAEATEIKQKAAEKEKEGDNFGKAMSEWGKLQSASELSQLEKKLGLNSAQVEALKGAMADLEKERAQAYGKMFSGKGTYRDFAIADGAMPHIDAFAAEHLNDEQKKGYEEFKEQKEKDRIERNANEELMHLQTMMTLTDEQKDAAFGVFADFATNERPDDYMNMEPGGEAEMMVEHFLEPRIEAMSKILTPEQQTIYAEQTKVMMDMMTGMLSKEGEKDAGNEQ